MMEPQVYPNDSISDERLIQEIEFLADIGDDLYDGSLDPSSVSSDEMNFVDENLPPSDYRGVFEIDPVPVAILSKTCTDLRNCSIGSLFTNDGRATSRSTRDSSFSFFSTSNMLSSPITSIGSLTSMKSMSIRSIGSLASVKSLTAIDIDEAFPDPPSLNRQVTPPPPEIPRPVSFSFKSNPSFSPTSVSQDNQEITPETLSHAFKKAPCPNPSPPPRVNTTPRIKMRSRQVPGSKPVYYPKAAAKTPASKTKIVLSKTPTQPQKKKRARRKDPKIKQYVVKKPNDVLLGRGGCSNHHPGNTAYRKHILSLQKTYKTLSRDEKTECSIEVVKWVQNEGGGRFLKRDFKGGPWYIVTDATARQKVSQALREDHTPDGRALKKSKQKKRQK